MARTLGSASFSVDAVFNNAQIRAAADRANESIARAIKDVKPGADTSKLEADVKASALKIAKTQANMKIGAEVKDAQIDAELARIKAKADAASEAAGKSSGDSFTKSLLGSGFMSPETLGPAVAAGLALLPGAFAVAGAAGALALGVAFEVKSSKALQQQGKTLISGLETTMTGASHVLLQPISQAISELDDELPTVSKLFTQTFSDVAPLLKPITSGFIDMTETGLGGFNDLLKQAQGPLESFFSTAQHLVGVGLAGFFKNLGPGVASSLNIITALFRIVSSLLPVLGQLATIVADVVAPSMVVLAEDVETASKILAPFLNLVEKGAALYDKYSSSTDKAGKSTQGFWGQVGHLAVGAASAIGGVGLLQQGLNLYNKVTGDSTAATAAYNKVVSANRTALLNSTAAVGKAAGAQLPLQTAIDGVVNKLVAQDGALQTADQAWTRYFGILGSGQAALSTVATDITNSTAALKQYGAGSIQYRAAIDQQITDNETYVQALQSQVKAAGNTSAAQALMKQSFLDSARAQLTNADGSKVLQDSLVLQARQAGDNITTWAQLHAQLVSGKGGLDAASKSTDGLSQQQLTNTQRAAAMSQAHSVLTSTLAKAQQQGKLTSQQVADLSGAIQHNVGQVDTSKTAFEQFASKLGISKTNADNLWASLKRAAGNYAANVKIAVSGGGTVKIQGDVAVSANGISTNLSSGQVSLPSGESFSPTDTGHEITETINHARGGVIRGKAATSQTQDTHLAMVKTGELIIPSQHAAKFNDMARRASIPGFAAGGVLGASSSFSSASSVGSSLGAVAEPQFAQSVGQTISNQTVTALAKALKSGVSQAASEAASGAGGKYGGPSSFGGGFESLAALTAYARYFMANGLNRAAAAGVAGTISGEQDSLGPESVGSGGFGLIGWRQPITEPVLTVTGYRPMGQVKPGDLVIGSDGNPTEVLAVYPSKDAAILEVRFRDGAWTRATVEHLWKINDGYDWRVVTTGDLRPGMSIPVLPGDEPRYVTGVYDLGYTEDCQCLTVAAEDHLYVTRDRIVTHNTGNTVGLPAGYHGPTGNVAFDLAQQLAGVIGYARARGGLGRLNAAGASGGPVAAGDVWSSYEAPLVPDSDTRPATALAIYAALGGMARGGIVKKYANGGLLPAGPGFGVVGGIPLSFNEGGRRERIVPDRGNANADVVNMLAQVIDAVKGTTQAVNFGTQTNNKALGGVGHGLRL